MFDLGLRRRVPTYQVLGLPRNPIGVALKDVLSLGIWGKFWLVRINRELDGHERFRVDFRWLWVLVLLPLITPLVVKWKTLHRLHKALRHQVTLTALNPKVLFLISLVPILGTVTWTAWTQSLLNRHWLWHKRDERIEAKANRIAELRPHAGEAKVRAKIATLETEVRELETQRETEVAAYEARRRVREEKAAARSGRPRRSLIPVKLGRRTKETAEAEGLGEEPPARKPPLAFLRKRKEKPVEAPTAPEEPVAAPTGELSPKEQKKLDNRRATEEAKRAKLEAKAEKARAKEEAKAAKRAEKEARKRAKKGEPEPPAAPAAAPPPPAPVVAAVPAPAPPTTTTVAQVQSSGGAQLTKTVKVLTLRCPQCQSRIEGIRKVAGEATPVECPRCHFRATI